MTPEEYEFELFLARMFNRPPCTYIKDKPFYPYIPTPPPPQKYMVNFDLNPPE